jgi:hypothetical protein
VESMALVGLWSDQHTFWPGLQALPSSLQKRASLGGVSQRALHEISSAKQRSDAHVQHSSILQHLGASWSVLLGAAEQQGSGRSESPCNGEESRSAVCASCQPGAP